MGKIFALYSNDNEDRLPQSVVGGELNDREAYWIVATLPYYTVKDIRLCPLAGNTPLGFDLAGQRWNENLFGSWSSNGMRLFCIDRHDGTINGVFLDLSARKIGLKELWMLKWHKEFDTSGYIPAGPGLSPLLSITIAITSMVIVLVTLGHIKKTKCG